jgi:hypothetical protein
LATCLVDLLHRLEGLRVRHVLACQVSTASVAGRPVVPWNA